MCRDARFAVQVDRDLGVPEADLLDELAQVEHRRIDLRSRRTPRRRSTARTPTRLLLRELRQVAVARHARISSPFSMAAASARMPRPDVFSERKSSSMMTMESEISWGGDTVR